MVEPGEDLRFLHEAFQSPFEIVALALALRLDREAGQPDRDLVRDVFLDRDLAVLGQIVGEIGDAEAAVAQHTLEPIAMLDMAVRQPVAILLLVVRVDHPPP